MRNMHAYIPGHNDGRHSAEESNPAEDEGDESGHQCHTQTIVTQPPELPGHSHHLRLLLHHGNMGLVGIRDKQT